VVDKYVTELMLSQLRSITRHILLVTFHVLVLQGKVHHYCVMQSRIA